MDRVGAPPRWTPPGCVPTVTSASHCSARCRSTSRAPSDRGGTLTRASGDSPATPSWGRPSSWHVTGSRPRTTSQPTSRRWRRSLAQPRRTTDSTVSSGRTAARGDPANASISRPLRRPSRRWRAMASTRSTTATSARGKRPRYAPPGAS